MAESVAVVGADDPLDQVEGDQALEGQADLLAGDRPGSRCMARRTRRMSSSLLPLNMTPETTSSHPVRDP